MKGGWCESFCQGQKDTEGRQAEPRECALAPEEGALGWLLSYPQELQGLEGLEMLQQKLEGPCLGPRESSYNLSLGGNRLQLLKSNFTLLIGFFMGRSAEFSLGAEANI
nr:uncharacterized protein LOC101057935 [Pan troglodytes]